MANISHVGVSPYSLFVDTKNTIYVAAEGVDRVVVFHNGSSTLIRNITGNMSMPKSVFATKNGDVYIDNGMNYGRVDLWKPNATNGIRTMIINASCYSLFVDTRDNLYCSIDQYNQVIKRTLNNGSMLGVAVAGDGSNGSSSWSLYSPRGIFVDLNFALYVADCGNDRVQLFQPDQRNGTTIVDNTTIALNCPGSVVLDADGYLYIVDGRHHRIVAGGPNGYQCIIGCSGRLGSTASDLGGPRSLSFDSYGNIYVADRLNDRIQKFSLIPSVCGKFHEYS